MILEDGKSVSNLCYLRNWGKFIVSGEITGTDTIMNEELPRWLNAFIFKIDYLHIYCKISPPKKARLGFGTKIVNAVMSLAEYIRQYWERPDAQWFAYIKNYAGEVVYARK